MTLALHWPSLDPGPWTLAFGHWSRRTLVAIGTGRFRRSSFSARDGARNPLDQPSKIQQPIRRIVQTTIKGSSMKFRSRTLSKHARSPPAARTRRKPLLNCNAPRERAEVSRRVLDHSEPIDARTAAGKGTADFARCPASKCCLVRANKGAGSPASEAIA